MKKYSVRAHANAKQASVVEKEGVLVVRVTASAHDGKANTAIQKAIADYFDIPKTLVTIIKGHTSKDKVVTIDI